MNINKYTKIFYTAIFAILLASSCSKNSGFDQFSFNDIDSISPSVIGRLEPIYLVFKTDISYKNNLNKAITFSSKINGQLELKDNKTIVFTPSKAYTAESEIILTADIGLLMENKAGKKGFQTTFTVQPVVLDVEDSGLQPLTDGKSFKITGTVTTDIPVTADDVKGFITIKADGNQKDFPITITETGVNTRYEFLIEGLTRSTNSQTVTIDWNGESIGCKDSVTRSFTIPAENVFQATGFLQEDSKTFSVSFSDYIGNPKELGSFISINSPKEFTYRYESDGAKIKLYCQDTTWPDGCEINILEGLKSSNGKVLKEKFSVLLKNSWDIPSISFLSQNNIVPASGGGTVLIKTKNIKGVIIQAFQVYENNVLQFFQQGSINDSPSRYRLKYVGAPVWGGSFDFEWKPSMKNREIVRSIDISELAKKFPNGIFSLQITFAKQHSMYESPRKETDFSHLPFPSENIYQAVYGGNPDSKTLEEAERMYIESAGLSSEQLYEFWDQRENPCHPAFYLEEYNSAIFPKKHVLLSDLVLTVKKDENKKLYIAASDLITAKPAADTEITVFSYAQKKLVSGKTGADGLIALEPEHEPYFVQGKKGKNFAWVQLDNSVLSTSHFEVGGESGTQNVKGFIYTERDVRRPGDDIHLVFILQDMKKNLPDDLPVRFVLEDPFGKVTDQKVLTSSVDGFYRITSKTAANDPTGRWTAKITAGGSSWSKIIKIEAIMPNRLFITLKPENQYLSAGENTLRLSSEWLHGAKAAGLKAEINCRCFLDRVPFPEYKDFTFTDGSADFQSVQKQVWTGRLDENGTAELPLRLNSGGQNPGKLKAVFETRIYEPSGVFSVENKVLDYSPFPEYAGLKIPEGKDSYRKDMLFTNEPTSISFLVLTPDGKPVKGSSELQVDVHKLSWQWWWEKDAYSAAGYNSSNSATLVQSHRIKAQNGKASWALCINNDWGRYLISVTDLNSRHCASSVVYVDYPWWSTRSGNDAGSSSMLVLTAGKEKFLVGETAEITFPASEGSQALITIEKNGKVISQEWMKTVNGTNVFKLKLKPEYAPNIYVHISLIQKYFQTKNSLPIRLYGILPVMVENKDSRLSPIVKSGEVFEPNKKAKFVISEESGKPMTCTVAVVDEGLLGLTAFSAPNPWNKFYAKEASQLSTWDLYSYVSAAFGGKIETLLAIGGGDEMQKIGVKTAERFKPVVFFFGPYSLKANEKKEVEFDMPQYSGAVRLMVTAGKNGAYGVYEKTVKVKSDFIVMPSLPRTIGIGEEIEVPVTVFNGTDSQENVSVTLTAKGAVAASETKKLSVPANSDSQVTFKVKAQNKGIAYFNTSVSVGRKTASAALELDVLSRGAPYSHTETFLLEAGKTWAKELPSPGEAGTKKLSVEISQMPPLGLEKRLSYLLSYPYGCIEQITSKAFPQLFIPNFTDLTAEEIEKTKENIMSVIERYSGYQTVSGGFSYWPGGYEDPDASNYAGHFMLEAKKAGYAVDDAMFNNWLNRQTNAAKDWTESYRSSAETQAYRLYTLALAGKPDMGAMNRLKSAKNPSLSVKCLLANAYAFSGHASTARNIIRDIPVEVSSIRRYSYHSSISDAAMLLQTYTILDDKGGQTKLIPKLAELSAKGGYLSTYETAWILTALSPFYSFDKSKPVKYKLITKNRTVKDELRKSYKLYSMDTDDADSQSLQVENTGNTPLYAVVKTITQATAGQEIPENTGLDMKVYYKAEDGRGYVMPEQLRAGDRFKVEISVQNITKVRAEKLALVLPVPTGWEFTNTRLVADDAVENSENYDYRDIKDSHIYTHFELEPNEKKTFTFQATAVYGGAYYIPAIYAEAMYDPSYKAMQKGSMLKAFLQ